MTFAPGQSGNPGGKSKSQKMFRDALVVALKRASADGVEAIQEVADGLVSKAIADRDVQAIREIADRIDGKVPQGVGGSEDLPAIATKTEVVYTIVDPANPNLSAAGVSSVADTGPIQGSLGRSGER